VRVQGAQVLRRGERGDPRCEQLLRPSQELSGTWSPSQPTSLPGPASFGEENPAESGTAFSTAGEPAGTVKKKSPRQDQQRSPTWASSFSEPCPAPPAAPSPWRRGGRSGGALVTEQLGDVGIGGAEDVGRERWRYYGRSRCSPVVVLAALILSTTNRDQHRIACRCPRAPAWLANCFH
jgi:hypothetical protein